LEAAVSDYRTSLGFRQGGSRSLRERWAAVHESVFAKLMAIMVAMAACLVLLVTVFFWMILSLVSNTAGHRTHDEAHVALFVVLLFVMGAVVLTAHAVLRRLLSPLRGLSEGVARLGSGQLDVVVPISTRDEFATLTGAFNQMVRRVREMIGARDQLLLDVSHELRSPVTRMKVALELLPHDEQRTRMAADVAEMERLIAELLKFERLRDSRAIKTARQDLTPLMREVAESFQNRPPGVRVVSMSREIPVDIDAEKVRTVLRNLLENAVKYSLPTSHPVEISAAQNADTVAIRVTDDGVGIPEGDLERVFEPFFRVDRSRSKSTGGYGLGLSICKRVMEAHGGSIAVERLTGGTSFVLTFPKAAFAKSA
jgi:signal transduction histidine kinase